MWKVYEMQAAKLCFLRSSTGFSVFFGTAHTFQNRFTIVSGLFCTALSCILKHSFFQRLVSMAYNPSPKGFLLQFAVYIIYETL